MLGSGSSDICFSVAGRCWGGEVLHFIDIVNVYNKLRPARRPKMVYCREELRLSICMDCYEDNTLDGKEVLGYQEPRNQKPRNQNPQKNKTKKLQCNIIKYSQIV